MMYGNNRYVLISLRRIINMKRTGEKEGNQGWIEK